MHVYLITDLTNSKQYVGAEKGNKPKYFGSGRLIIETIEQFGKWNFKKEILIDDKYIDSWEECLRLESACILSLNTLVPNGYNITWWNWPIPFEILSKAGKRTHELYPEEQKKWSSKAGKIKGEKDKRLGTGIFASGMQSKGGKIVGKKMVEEKKGIHNPAYNEKRLEWCSKAGRIKGEMNAHILFEIDGLLQQTTLGAIFRT